MEPNQKKQGTFMLKTAMFREFLFAKVFAPVFAQLFAIAIAITTIITSTLAQAATPEYFAGIVKLSNCSASLVKFETSQPTDKGIILTNGHCVGDMTKSGRMIRPNQFVHNEDIDSMMGRYYATANFLNPKTGATIGKSAMRKILYATMTGTDMALLELEDTFADIEKKYSTLPLLISSKRSDIGDKVIVVSGYHRQAYHCAVEAIVPELLEGGYTMTESIRYARGCDTIPGTSGSPILNADLNLVVGVNNTGNEDGGMCNMNNPCQKWPGKPDEAVEGRAYGQQIDAVYTCLTADRKIDLSIKGCQLFGTTNP